MPQSLEEIEALPKEMLIPADIAKYLGCDQYYINLMARDNPEKLGFSVIKIGSRVKIPKAAFVYYCKYGRPIVGKEITE